MSMDQINRRIRARTDAGSLVGTHVVGNALVLHATEKISDAAQSLAMFVAEDTEHDLVLLDLPPEMPMSIWESMADALPRRRRGIRLILDGKSRETAVLAGQWLSERLGRTVVAPDGHLIRGAAGALFVHSGRGSGWVRFRPGKPPAWDAKRFPRPVWDRAVAEVGATSSTGVAEPLPGGMWIHDIQYEEPVRECRGWLLAKLPCQHETLTVVLGCPGTPPVSLDDIARFWRELDEDSRQRARFVAFGMVHLPKGETLGQALADLLGEPVVCYPGVPVGAPPWPTIYTILPDGQFGWQPFARELGYVPRPDPSAPATTPVVLSHRPPLPGAEPIEPLVYWYAPDAVIEVVQSGLWIRPPEVPEGADLVRATRPNPEVHTVVFDDSTGETAQRMRGLAEDIVARLEPATRDSSLVTAASMVVPDEASVPGRRAVGSLPRAVTLRSSEAGAATGIVEKLADGGVNSFVDNEPAPTVAAPVNPFVDGNSQPSVPAPVDIPAWPSIPQVPVQWPALEPTNVEGGDQPVEPALPAAPRHALSTGVGDLGAGPAASPAAWETVATTPVPALSNAARRATGGASGPASQHGGAPASADAASRNGVPQASADGIRLESPPVGPGGQALVQTIGPREPDPKTERPSEPPVEQPKRPRLQPVPQPGASALLSGRGLDEERAWLRRTLSREYDAVASSISRVLSEHPGFQAGGRAAAETVTDAVAVRLYLTAKGEAIDAALRSAKKGPHVPFARCVVSGLTRLPSHRGATVFSVSPSPEEWQLYQDRKLVTDWGFINALTGPCKRQSGDVDVLIWSMTARRTKLLEPEGDEGVEDRVLFLPGTNFKVLDMAAPESGGKRGQVLLRELSANEIDSNGRIDVNRISLDDLARTSLRRCIEQWENSDPRSRTGTAALSRFGALPGLV
jgi:hypothetical protein